jgi:KDO2-lipid IV(A) lauroyltransferase
MPDRAHLEAVATKPEAAPPDLSGLKPSLLGSALFALIPYRRKLVLSNLRQVFGDRLSEAELRHLARCFYSHLARIFLENMAMTWSSMERVSDKVDLIGVDHVLKAADGGRGILILTGHFGNWELGAVAAMLQFKQYRNRFHVIRKPLVPILEQVVFSAFRRAGLEIIPRDDAMTRVLDVLERNDLVIFIMDQHAVVGARAAAVDFFGKKAGTSRSLAVVAARSGAPVIPAICYRKPDGRHVVRFDEPLKWIYSGDPGEEIYLNTRAYNRVLEGFVLEHPEQWFWLHRRWKLDLRAPTARARRMQKRGRDF